MLFQLKRNSPNAEKNKKKKSPFREWTSALVFAVVAATLIRTFSAEAYTIPSGSMEGSLLIHDYLFVNKMAYGPRIPVTPLAVPLVHNTMPVTGGKSYSEAIKWGYHRVPGYSSIQRNDIVVFNGPSGDTAMADQPEMDYYQLCRLYGRDFVNGKYTIVSRPVDKKENLIKRCVGLPGDILEVKDAVVYVNGVQSALLPHAKLTYMVTTNNGTPPAVDEDLELVQKMNSNVYAYNLPNDHVAMIRKVANVASVALYLKEQKGIAPAEPGDWVFPLDTANYKWNRDNYGPITIPKAGATVALTTQNIALYSRIIGTYEGNTLEQKDGQFIINGAPATSYTFKMNYYWMMGDNRHNSLDSRYWGFVPDDHVVGKAWFVWLSYGDSPISDMRWGRLLRGIHRLDN